MSSVTSRVKEIKQPRGGYIKPSMFSKTVFDDGIVLNESENVHASIIGMVVDYMTRFLMTGNAEDAFRISITGYCRRVAFLSDSTSEKDVKKSGILKEDKELSQEEAKQFIMTNDGDNSGFKLLRRIKGLDDDSIVAACKIATYDVWYRNIMWAMMAKGADDINPNKQTVDNIRTLIQRSLSFWNKVGPISSEGFVFAEKDSKENIIKSGYTSTVDSGDGDYLTEDTMWDFKVSKSGITSQNTLQILMYYIMGQHSDMDVYKSIKKLGFFNPRLNTMYVLDVDTISDDVIKAVETEVICY